MIAVTAGRAVRAALLHPAAAGSTVRWDEVMAGPAPDADAGTQGCPPLPGNAANTVACGATTCQMPNLCCFNPEKATWGCAESCGSPELVRCDTTDDCALSAALCLRNLWRRTASIGIRRRRRGDGTS